MKCKWNQEIWTVYTQWDAYNHILVCVFEEWSKKEKINEDIYLFNRERELFLKQNKYWFNSLFLFLILLLNLPHPLNFRQVYKNTVYM